MRGRQLPSRGADGWPGCPFYAPKAGPGRGPAGSWGRGRGVGGRGFAGRGSYQKQYSGWDCMNGQNGLIPKGLVAKFSNPAKYELLSQGVALAEKLEDILKTMTDGGGGDDDVVVGGAAAEAGGSASRSGAGGSAGAGAGGASPSPRVTEPVRKRAQQMAATAARSASSRPSGDGLNACDQRTLEHVRGLPAGAVCDATEAARALRVYNAKQIKDSLRFLVAEGVIHSRHEHVDTDVGGGKRSGGVGITPGGTVVLTASPPDSPLYSPIEDRRRMEERARQLAERRRREEREKARRAEEERAERERLRRRESGGRAGTSGRGGRGRAGGRSGRGAALFDSPHSPLFGADSQLSNRINSSTGSGAGSPGHGIGNDSGTDSPRGVAGRPSDGRAASRLGDGSGSTARVGGARRSRSGDWDLIISPPKGSAAEVEAQAATAAPVCISLLTDSDEEEEGGGGTDGTDTDDDVQLLEMGLTPATRKAAACRGGGARVGDESEPGRGANVRGAAGGAGPNAATVPSGAFARSPLARARGGAGPIVATAPCLPGRTRAPWESQPQSPPPGRAPRAPQQSQPPVDTSVATSLPVRAPPRLAGPGPNARFVDHFDIILLMDTREQMGGRRGNAQVVGDVLRELNAEKGVTAEERTLSAGDVLWIARSKADPGVEYVLDYVLERKRVDDLASSIKHKNRYAEQKYYMKRSGLRRMLYLVEGDPDTLGSNAAVKAVQTAAVETDVFQGFKVVRTANVHETRRYYAAFTRAIYEEVALLWMQQMKAGRDPIEASPTYAAWKATIDKAHEVTVGMQWGVMLSQVPGMSGKSARAIVEAYPTPLLLMQAYERVAAPAAARDLLASLQPQGQVNRLGKRKSAAVYDMVMGAGGGE